MKGLGMIKGFRPAFNVSIIALATAVSSVSVQAQEAPPVADEAASGEIVVTAQKRSQTLIDVPISITALTGEQLQARGASELEDIHNADPGVTSPQTSTGHKRLQTQRETEC